MLEGLFSTFIQAVRMGDYQMWAWIKDFIQLFSSCKGKGLTPEWWTPLLGLHAGSCVFTSSFLGFESLHSPYLTYMSVSTLSLGLLHFVLPSPALVPCRLPQPSATVCALLTVGLYPAFPFLDQEDAGGEDGPRGCGAGARRGEHHWCGREHLDCQPLWPSGKDLEPWAASETGNGSGFWFHLLVSLPSASQAYWHSVALWCTLCGDPQP